MERRLVDGDELAAVIGTLAGQPVVNASWLLDSMVMLDLGVIRTAATADEAGEFVFTLETGTWRLVDQDERVVHSASGAGDIRAGLARCLHGGRVSRAHYDPLTAVLRLDLESGSHLVVTPHGDAWSDAESWSLTTPDGRSYSHLPGGRIELERSVD